MWDYIIHSVLFVGLGLWCVYVTKLAVWGKDDKND